MFRCHPGPPLVWRAETTNEETNSHEDNLNTAMIFFILNEPKTTRLYRFRSLILLYERRYQKRHARFDLLFRVERRQKIVFVSPLLLSARWRCKQEVSADAHCSTKQSKQSRLIIISTSKVISLVNFLVNNQVKMSKRFSTRGQTNSRGATRAGFNAKSSTVPLTIRARKLQPIAGKIYRLPIEFNLINGSEIYLYGKKSEGGLQLPSSTRIGTTRFTYDDSPKRFDANGDLLPSTCTVWSIVYRFKADQTDIIRNAIRTAKEAKVIMNLPKSLTGGLTIEKDGWSYCVKDIDTEVADTIKYVSLQLKNIKDIPDVEAPGGSKIIKKAIQDKGLDVSSNVYMQTHNNLSRVQIPTGAVYFWSRDLPDESTKKDGRFPLTNIPVKFQTFDHHSGHTVNNTVILKVRPVPPREDIPTEDRQCKVCDEKGHYSWECPKVTETSTNGASSFPATSERVTRDSLNLALENFPALSGEGSSRMANAWHSRSAAIRKAAAVNTDLVKDLTDALVGMKAAGNDSEEDIKVAIEKCLSACQNQAKSSTEEDRTVEKLTKKLKGEFIFHGSKPLYTVSENIISIDDISHREWDKFSAKVWGFNGREEASWKPYLSAFNPIDKDNESKEWKPKVKRTMQLACHIIRTLRWESLQQKKFERRDLLVTALTEPVEELQKIFQCTGSVKESHLEEWLGIEEDMIISWSSKPGTQDPRAKAAYAICLCLENLLSIDVNGIATLEDFATLNNRRNGKEKN